MKKRHSENQTRNFIPAWPMAFCAILFLCLLTFCLGDQCYGASADVIKNTTSGKAYETLNEALKDASDGDNLKLLKDVEINQPIELKVHLDIDLSGKKIEFALPDAVIYKECDLISITGKGRSLISNGSIVVKMSDPTLPASSHFFLSVVKIEGEASATLSDTHIIASYKCDKKSTNPPSIAGVRIDKGNCLLKESTSVDIEADGDYPAKIYGVYSSGLSKSEDPVLVQDTSTSIYVQNHTKRLKSGNVNRDAALTSASSPYLMEFHPDEDSELYKKLQDRFLVKAKADVSEDNEGNVNSLNLYYAAPLKLDDSYYVWAFSSPMSKNEIGLQSSIKATKFYGQTYYDVMPQTVGIYLKGKSSDNATPAVSAKVEGSIKAESDTGTSSALEAKAGASAHVLAKAKFSVKGTDDPYRELNGSLSAADLTGNPSDKDRFYPTKQSVAYKVKWIQAVSKCIPDKSNVTIGSGANLSNDQIGSEPSKQIDLPEAESALPNTADEARARFYHWKTLGTQTVYAFTQFTMKKGASASVTANEMVKPGTVVYHDDKVDNFLGWSVRRSDKQALFGTTLPDISEDCDYHAIYGQRERLISVNFIVGDKLYSLANSISAGKTVDYAFRNSSNSKKPGANKSGEAFRGWSLTPGGKPVTQMVKKLMELTDAENPLTLYAVYYHAESDSDSKALSPIGSSKNPAGSSNGATTTGKKRLSALKKTLPSLSLSAKAKSDKDPESLEDTDVEDVATQLIDGEDEVPEGLEDFGSAPDHGSESAEQIEESSLNSGSEMSGNAIGFFVLIGAIILLAGAFAWNLIRGRLMGKDSDYLDSLNATGKREVCF